MAYLSVPTPYALRGTALFCGIFCLLFSSLAYGETIRYSPEEAANFSRSGYENPGAGNPYAARRQAAAHKPPPVRLFAAEPLAPVQKIAEVKIAKPATPLKITIPNLKAVQKKPAAMTASVSMGGSNVASVTQKPITLSPPVNAYVTAASASAQPPAEATAPAGDRIVSVQSGAVIHKETIRYVASNVSPEEIKSQGRASLPDPVKIAESVYYHAPTQESELSKLTPSAGEPAGMDANAPLIATPDYVPPTPAAPIAPLPVAPVAVAPAPKMVISVTDAAPQIAGPIEKVEPAASTDASADYHEAALDSIAQDLDDVVAQEEPISMAPTVLPVIIPSGKDVVRAKNTTRIAAQDTLIEQPPVDESVSEPERDLSAESKKVVKGMPSGLDKRKKPGSELVEIDRTKDLSAISGSPGETITESTVKHEAHGIKIEMKNRKANLNYELEKAYYALLAGNTSEATEIYKNVLGNDANNTHALFGLATTYHRAGQIELARPLYAKLLALDPKNRDALNNFLVLMADEAPEQALTQLAELEARNSDFSPIPAQMAVIYQKLGDFDRASAKMFRAIALAPENLTYRYNLAIMLDKQKNYEEAAKLYRQILEASGRGEVIPGNPQKIQERLTFISSNRQ
jgi:Tfp pilus assembly protein PilF